MIALLLWLSLGNRSREQAARSGKDKRASWVLALDHGLFTVTPHGTLLLTEKGKAELEMARAMT